MASAVHVLNEEKLATGLAQQHTASPLSMVLERFANLEKTIAHMLAVNESEIYTFINSDTPISKLLAEDIPAVTNAKKELEQIIRRQIQSQSSLDKEQKKLDKMQGEEDIDQEALNSQREKREKIAYELENLTKDVSLEQDKLTSTLMTLVSRENRYAESVLEMMRLKKQFYENAFKTIEAELPNIERILQETNMRPVFGERLEDHLASTGRNIAFPIALTVRYMLDSGLEDEGLFRISPKQIKLDKFKAHIDSHQPLGELLADSDAHLYSALLKSYLRELPVSLLGDIRAYNRWIKASTIENHAEKIIEFQDILKEELSEAVVKNVQYVIKFLSTLSAKSQTTKMTPHNIAIVLGPTLLWPDRDFKMEQKSLENIISVVVTLIESYSSIFPVSDVDLNAEETELREMKQLSVTSPDSVPSSPVAAPPLPAANNNTSNFLHPSSYKSGLSPDGGSNNTSPSHKRKSSIRSMGKSMGRNIMDKIKVPGTSSTTGSLPGF